MSTPNRARRTEVPTTPRTRWRTSEADDRARDRDRGERPADASVLVVTGLSRKNERHYGPLADVADETTLVCLDPEYAIDDADYVRVPEIGPRILRVVLLFFAALYEGFRGDYDAVASISLLPYGLYALVLKAVYGYPAHLGIIGIDLDHHAYQWYGPAVRWTFRRFDAVSVPGSVHAETLVRFGVPAERVEILTNAIDVETYRPPGGETGSEAETTTEIETETGTEYEFVWVGRFSEEKDPVRFVRAVAALDASGREFRAAMVGDGPLRDAVADEIAARGLEDRIDLPGWVDNPAAYYRRGEAFVLTSRRDALPLVLLEAMASGLAPIVPPVGSIPDVVVDGYNGLVVPSREPSDYAAAMERILDDEYREVLAANATAVRSSFSMTAASEDWRRILTTLSTGESSRWQPHS